MKWMVHEGGKVKALTAATVVRKLRNNQLSGVELARREDDAEWRPLHATPLFATAIPHTGDSAAQARSRVLKPFTTHLLAYFGVILWQWYSNTWGFPPPGWVFLWGIGLALHGVKTASTIRGIAGTAAAPSVRESVADSPLLRAIDQLPASGWSGEVGPLREAATELTRRSALVEAALSEDGAREALLHERESVSADRALADPDTQALLDDQLAAIDARVAFLDEVQRVAVRLRAQERTLLHQVESLRLGQIRTTEERPATDLEAAVTRLRRELDAEREVTDSLARARQAQRL